MSIQLHDSIRGLTVEYENPDTTGSLSVPDRTLFAPASDMYGAKAACNEFSVATKMLHDFISVPLSN